MNKRHSQGFSLIEMIATMAIMAVLMGIAVPSFSNAIKNGQLSEQSRALMGSLYMARSEAIKQGKDTTVCARKNNSKCGTDWKKGWIVFVDATNVTSETTAVIDVGDEILEIREPLDENTLSSFGSSNGTIAGKSSRNFVRYNSRGETDWQGGSFTLCDDRLETYGRSINIVLTGDIRSGRKDESTDKPMDVFNQVITCGT